MNTLQAMNHALRALDGPGIEPKLWSELTTIEQHNIAEQYLRGMNENECDSLREQAARAYYNIIARHADRNRKLKDIVLG